MMRKTLVAALFSSVMALSATSASAEKLILKFGHVGNPGSLFEASVNEFVKNANARLGDRAEVQAFGSSQLGKDKELLQKLKLGQVDFALPSSVMSSVADAFGVFEMPYIIKSRDHMKAVQAEIGDSVFNAAAEENGYKILSYFENGFRHITNNTRPVNTPDDLEGIKLRTPNGEWRVKMFKLLMARKTRMRKSGLPSSRKYKSTCRSQAMCIHQRTF